MRLYLGGSAHSDRGQGLLLQATRVCLLRVDSWGGERVQPQLTFQPLLCIQYIQMTFRHPPKLSPHLSLRRRRPTVLSLAYKRHSARGTFHIFLYPLRHSSLTLKAVYVRTGGRLFQLCTIQKSAAAGGLPPPALSRPREEGFSLSIYPPPLYLEWPSKYNNVFGCPSKYNDGRWPHAASQRNRRAIWHSIAHFHHTPAHPIYWEDHFASCVRGHRRCR